VRAPGLGGTRRRAGPGSGCRAHGGTRDAGRLGADGKRARHGGGIGAGWRLQRRTAWSGRLRHARDHGAGAPGAVRRGGRVDRPPGGAARAARPPRGAPAGRRPVARLVRRIRARGRCLRAGLRAGRGRPTRS
jgi:hypothetical protein